MSKTTMYDLLDYITSEATDADVDRIHEALKLRDKAVRNRRAAAVGLHAQVSLTGLSPKALNGLTGKVTRINGARCDVLLDEASTTRLRYGRTRHYIPAETTEYVLHGVPMSCCAVVVTA